MTYERRRSPGSTRMAGDERSPDPPGTTLQNNPSFISPYSSPFRKRFASQRPLLAVIFSSENAPDSQTGFVPGISQNISAVFSRISAILGVGTPSREDSLRRRSGAGKRVGFYRFCWEFQVPKTGFLLFPHTPAHQKGLSPAKRVC